MRAPIAVLMLYLATATAAFAAPRIAFERLLPAAHDLGSAEEIAVVFAIGDHVKVEAFVDRFVHQLNRSGVLRATDARRERERRADAYLSVKSFTCKTREGEGEGGAYDVDGKRVRRRHVWADATCMARIDVLTGKARSSFFVKGEGTSPRVAEVTDEERNIAFEQAARYAAVTASERITPRRVRESIPLDDTAPAFEEAYALIDIDRFADARALWERVLAQQPRSAALHYNLGAICEALGDTRSAELHYVAARRLAPTAERYTSELRLFRLRKPK
ncbi:MAG TPA: hypothetical protein VNA69_08765 [Thermoanaerobaculia bacterium]|nr:hypothetical protein [Thermoanaerobaculia bacterium]